MLRALREQLNLLAADPRNHYTSIIRRLAGPREAVRYEQPLRQMILAMPEMIAQSSNGAGGLGRPVRLRRIRGFVLDYLYNPTDFLPAHGPGLFGYLDDAYLIARIYHLTLADGPKHHVDGESLERNLPVWIKLARRLLPKETLKMDELLDGVARRRNRGIQRAFTKPVKRNGTVHRLEKQR